MLSSGRPGQNVLQLATGELCWVHVLKVEGTWGTGWTTRSKERVCTRTLKASTVANGTKESHTGMDDSNIQTETCSKALSSQGRSPAKVSPLSI